MLMVSPNDDDVDDDDDDNNSRMFSKHCLTKEFKSFASVILWEYVEHRSSSCLFENRQLIMEKWWKDVSMCVVYCPLSLSSSLWVYLYVYDVHVQASVSSSCKWYG